MQMNLILSRLFAALECNIKFLIKFCRLLKLSLSTWFFAFISDDDVLSHISSFTVHVHPEIWVT